MLPLAVPRKFIFLPAMPVNANGKTDYVKLNARARELETDLSPDEVLDE
jgi:acyl-coenzyme A synthetase/AMP-(fatty) acid ligase